MRLVDGGARARRGRSDATPPRAAEFARRINERAKAKPGEWILGGHWDERRWTPPELPVRALIDDVTNSSPVFVIRYDGRMALANAAALGRAGITERTPDPPGGAIVRDANGFPTGVLQGAAMDIVARVIPKITAEQRLRVLKRALEYAESLGITSVQDVGATDDDIAVYADLANRGELTVRVYALPPEVGWYDQAKLGLHRAFGSPWLRIGGGARAWRSPRDLERTADAADGGGSRRPATVRRCGGGRRRRRGAGLLDAIARGNGGRDRRSRRRIRLTRRRRAARIRERGRARAAGSPAMRARPAAGPRDPLRSAPGGRRCR